MTSTSIIPCYVAVSLAYSGIAKIINDEVVSPYVLSILINLTYLSTLAYVRFQPSTYVASHIMSLLIAYYAFDTNKLLRGTEPLKEKLTFIPHHVVSIVLIVGQLLNLYPLTQGMWFLTFFELSNFFLQFFQLANKKQWRKLRSIVSYPFVLTYIPFRGIVIPIYSLKFIPHIVRMHPFLCATYLGMFAFIDIFSVYFAVHVLHKFIGHIHSMKSKTCNNYKTT